MKVLGPAVLAERCAAAGVALVTFSSDQVFDGTIARPRVGEVDRRALRRKIGWVGSFLQAQVPPSTKPL